MKAVLLTLAVAAALGAPQAPPQGARDASRPQFAGSASIIGTVTSNDAERRPVRQAAVSVTGYDAAVAVGRVVMTDDAGRFAVLNLPAGRFYLSVSKGGWVSASYGAPRPNDGGIPIALGEGEQSIANVSLTRGGVIAGRVVDENGLPQANARPALLEYRTISGQRRLVTANSLASIFTVTNDLGEYRMYGVLPGTYVIAIRPAFQVGGTARLTTDEEVRWALQQSTSGTPAVMGPTSAAPARGAAVTFAPVYHPGGTDPAAAVIVTVQAGEDKLGIDFVLTQVRTAQVQGVVTRPDGQPASGARLTITRTRAAQSPIDTSTSSVVSDAGGRFTFNGVAPGDYTIVARASSPGVSAPAPGPRPGAPDLDLWGMTDLSVGGPDISGLALPLQIGMTMSGRVAFEASANTTPPGVGGLRIMMASAAVVEIGFGGGGVGPGMNMFTGMSKPDGTFSFIGVMPGRYVLSANVSGPGASAWMPKAVMVGGRNVLEGGFDVRAGENISDAVVVFTDLVGEISGTLLDSAGRPAPECYVFVFPTDKTVWTPLSSRMRSPARPSSDGKYSVTRLPPGDYYVVALTRFDPENLYDTAFLEQAAAAALKVSLAEGEKKVLQLRR